MRDVIPNNSESVHSERNLGTYAYPLVRARGNGNSGGARVPMLRKDEAARNGATNTRPGLATNQFRGSPMAGLHDKPRDEREQDRFRSSQHQPHERLDDDCWQSVGEVSNAIVLRLLRERQA